MEYLRTERGETQEVLLVISFATYNMVRVTRRHPIATDTSLRVARTGDEHETDAPF